MSRSYEGHCHCKRVSFEFHSPLDDVFVCNCSYCRRRAAVLQRVRPEDFRISSGEQDLSSYGARDFSKHYFCNHCGIFVFTRLLKKGRVAVNLLCVDSIDPETLTPTLFDGKNLL